jgi:hypothetical protein
MMPSALALKPKAIALLAKLLKPHGELLPFPIGDETCAIFNALKVLEALDESRSVVWRSSEGRLLDVRRYAVVEDAIGDVDIFKVRGLNVCPILFTQAAVKAWQVTGVLGIQFLEIGETVEAKPKTSGLDR